MTRAASRAASGPPASTERQPVEAAGVASDASLVLAMAAGERPALAELYDRYAPTLLTLAQRLLRSSSDAEDLLHDFFLEVWHQAHTFDGGRGSVQSWLVMRLRSRALDRLKSASYTRNISLGSIGIDIENLPNPNDTPPEVTPNGIQQALAMLAPHELVLLDLAYFQGCSLPEVATHLGLPLGTVKSRLRRLIERLRREFDKSPRRGPS